MWKEKQTKKILHRETKEEKTLCHGNYLFSCSSCPILCPLKELWPLTCPGRIMEIVMGLVWYKRGKSTQPSLLSNQIKGEVNLI